MCHMCQAQEDGYRFSVEQVENGFTVLVNTNEGEDITIELATTDPGNPHAGYAKITSPNGEVKIPAIALQCATTVIEDVTAAMKAAQEAGEQMNEMLHQSVHPN